MSGEISPMANNTLLKKKIRAQFITQWTQQLALLLQAHLPLAQALQLLTQTCHPPQLRLLTQTLHQNVLNGSPLSQALATYPHYFDPTYCQLIIAAEQSGRLTHILQRIADQRCARQRLRSQLFRAFSYPSLVLTVGSSIVILLLLWIVPQIAEIYAQFNQPLPQLTRLILSVADFMQRYGLYCMLSSLLLSLFIYLLNHYQLKWRIRCDRWLWNCPGIGTLVQSASCILFANTLATLLSAGLPLMTGLPTSAQLISNKHAQMRLLAAVALIQQGHSFSYALQQTHVFPHLAIQMWQIGEHSGRLSELLQESAAYYQLQLDTVIAQLLQLLEPFLLVVLGILIGGVVIAMYLPLFNLGLVIK